MVRKRRTLANNEAFHAVAIESLSTFTAHFKSLVNLLYTGKIISDVIIGDDVSFSRAKNIVSTRFLFNLRRLISFINRFESSFQI